ncbi:hypothetical protein [Ruegeria atlantica]|uniref:Uncharacterized protein n=1 Tax=Ruegeria atlantica TaxID=81569 RepID=A0A0P1E148_9RHOB|nr:hypothetical protein [Ruegeria atlantica]CUH41567.1 hypothetical protein RUM4293_00441 [Ruegeria atlantica]
MPRPTVSLRIDQEHRDLMRRVNTRLHDDPMFSEALEALLADENATAYMRADEVKRRLAEIADRLSALEGKGAN